MLKLSLLSFLLLFPSCSDLKKINTIYKVVSRQIDMNIDNDKAIIEGHLIDRLSGEPIIYGYISVPAIKKDIKTDNVGFFSFEAPKGKILIIAQYAGNTKYTRYLNIKSQEKITLKISLGTTYFYCE